MSQLHLSVVQVFSERSEFLKVLRGMEPKGVILSENNMKCCCSGCGDFATGFSRRVEDLWKFLDSISSTFKNRDSDERRMMEGASASAKALANQREMNERKGEKNGVKEWRSRVLRHFRLYNLKYVKTF